MRLVRGIAAGTHAPYLALGDSLLVTAQPPAKSGPIRHFLGRMLILAALAIAAIAEWHQWYGATVSQTQILKALVPPTLDGLHPCVYASVSAGRVVSALGSCATPVSHAQPDNRFETDLRYGSFVLRQTDLPLDDVFNAPLERAYTTRDWGSPSHQHAFGFNASDSFDIAPTGSRWPYTYLTLMLEDGDFLYFKRISPGSGFSNAVYLHTETSTRFYKATIAWNGRGWTLRLAHGSEMLFPEAYSAKNLAQCAAYEIRNAAGDKLLLQRDARRNLQEVLTPHGHWIRLRYDDQARIVQAADDKGSVVRYRYNSAGMLSDVFYSNGAERHYEYQGRLMTAVTDEHGRELVRNWYRNGLVSGQLFDGRDRYAYDYSWTPAGYSVSKVVIALPNGAESTVFPSDSVPAYLRSMR